MFKPFGVVVVSSDRARTGALEETLARTAGIDWMSHVGDAPSALALLTKKSGPRVILLVDAELPDQGCRALLGRLHVKGWKCLVPVIVVTGIEIAEETVQLYAAGAAACLTAPATLVEAESATEALVAYWGRAEWP